MAALPYMPLFVADYLADTAHLTPAQHGSYLLLIMNYWQRGGPLPNDDQRLARIARMNMRDWARNRDEILEFFDVQENLLVHARIDAELSRVEAKSLKCKDAAQASVQRRFGERSTDVEPTDTHTYKKKEPNGSSKERAFPEPPGVSAEQWSAFKAQRKKRLNARSYQLLCNKLNDLAEHGWPPGQMVDLAIERGWETVFAPKEQHNGRTDRLGRHQPADGLSATTRAALQVFGAPGAGQH